MVEKELHKAMKNEELIKLFNIEKSNVVVKFLTAITIILMIPTLIASIYVMNVKLPFQESPYAFLITLGISFILLVIGVSIFIKRKWF